MSPAVIARLAAAALLFPCGPALAGPIEIDLPAAIARARQLAPDAAAARGDVAIAEARVVGADLPFVANPELEAGLGPRLTAGRPIDAELRLEQPLELGRRTARRSLARAEVAGARADAAVALRALDLEVTNAFDDALFAQRAVELAQHGEDLAGRAADVAARRRRAGEITDLDANLARSAAGRARAATLAARGALAVARGRLAGLIGADDEVIARGALKPAPLDDVRGALADRADLRALEAARRVAEAEGAAAAASARPELALWASYQREDRDAIVLGGLRLTLPVWNRAQGERAAASAKQARASALREATGRAAARALAAAIAADREARAAVDGFERDVVPVLDDSEQLLERSIAAGQLAIADYLVARQELLDGRREHLERLRALAQAAATVRFMAGGAP